MKTLASFNFTMKILAVMYDTNFLKATCIFLSDVVTQIIDMIKICILREIFNKNTAFILCLCHIVILHLRD